jgi:hypothetical protein
MSVMGAFGVYEEEKTTMTQDEKNRYESVEVLREYLQALKGRKFRLDCGHHLTMGHFLGNNIMVYNGIRLKIICSLCSY